MRHAKYKKLGKPADQRQALLRSLARELILREKITATLARAKAVKGFLEKIITTAKKGDLASRRRVLSLLPDKKVVKRLYDALLSRFEARKSGYLRLTKVAARRGDAAPQAVLEFVD